MKKSEIKMSVIKSKTAIRAHNFLVKERTSKDAWPWQQAVRDTPAAINNVSNY